MADWRPQHFSKHRPAEVSPETIDSAVKTAAITQGVNKSLPPIFSLRHLADYTSIDYKILRSIVSRSGRESYRSFLIHKRPTYPGERRYRRIYIPSEPLMAVQRWINQRVLQHCSTDSASVAFARDCKILDAAELHCQSRWLVKVDVVDFFDSINEISVYRVYRRLGYQPLVAFELARLCTQLSEKSGRKCWRNFRMEHDAFALAFGHEPEKTDSGMKIKSYDAYYVGHLPQGAPTSPMLANLVMRSFDKELRELASKAGFVYTRYADDITLSTESQSSRQDCIKLLREVYGLLSKVGLSPNSAKTRIVPPGAKKMVLGLVVNGAQPRLSRDFRMRIRQHLYYLSKPNGPVEHAKNRGFASISGLRHHLQGLAAYACQIDAAYGKDIKRRLNSVAWPS